MCQSRIVQFREGVKNKELYFLGDMSLSSDPNPNALQGTNKIYFYPPFFIQIPIEPECSEIDNSYKKIGCDRLPRHYSK